MDTDGTDIDPYTKVIPPYMVLTYASDYDSNSKINRDSDYKLEDNDDNILGAKKILGGTYMMMFQGSKRGTAGVGNEDDGKGRRKSRRGWR